jgi:hypothetical protein
VTHKQKLGKFDIHLNMQTLDKTRPYATQLAKLISHKDWMVRRLGREIKKRGGGNQAKIIDLTSRIMHAEFEISNLNMKFADPTKFKAAGREWNKQAGGGVTHVRRDKGRIAFSKNGRYDVDQHSGAVPKGLLNNTNPIVVNPED